MRKKIDLFLLLLVLVGGFFALQNATAIGDWWFLRTYHPPEKIAEISEDANLTENGQNLFYRFSPNLYTAEEINRHCEGEKLGCIEGQNIYLLNYKSQADYNRTVVTAAHEMLHVVYDRLDEDEKNEINKLLENELNKSAASEINEKLSGYPKADFYDEAHSFIGTEVKDINPKLEQHYAEYFKNRSELVQLHFRSSN